MRSFAFGLLAATAVALASACSDPTPPPARVILDSEIGPGNNGMMACEITDEPWIQIGGFGNPPDIPVRPVDTGTDNGNGAVTITCSVKGNDAAGYDVAASATLQGAEGGTVSITGHFAVANGDPTQVQTGITGVFQRSDFGTFRESDCTVDYNENHNMGVAAGRVWGQLTCPMINRPDQNRTCLGTAQFRFENCDQ